MAVAPGAPGEPAWTDGITVFVDGDQSVRRQIEAVAVQASLIAGRGLEPEIVRDFVRRPGLARRYLAVEGNRALAANEELLPCPVRSMIDLDLAARVDSPAASLALAARWKSVEPPANFGTIKPRDLLAARTGAQQARTDGHDPLHSSTGKTAELVEDDDGDETPDPFSSPVGGGGAIGKLLQRMLRRVRQLGDGGSPGADTPTHRTRDGLRGRGVVTSTAAAASEGDDTDARHGFQYPEWDAERQRYRRDWCTVIETNALRDQTLSLDRPDVHALRRPLTRLGIGLDRAHRQAQGDDIDIDAAVEARAELLAGSAPDEAVYLDNLRRRRDLAVLVLLDISGSSSEAGTSGKTVHEQQRATAAALTVALHQLGDRVALYAYQSQGRSAVHMIPVKQFDESLDAAVMQRLASLSPGAYSRLGAAIRHGSAVLSEKAGTSRRLLVVVSDGLAYDHGYERAYGAADARRALGEARRGGIGCLCLTIGAATDTGELAKVFGSAAYASIPKPERLADVVGPLFRAGLRSADLRRRVTTRAGS
jgi:hypothetical protein